MPEDMYIQHIRGIATESAFSTLTEDEILTGATPGGMLKAEAIGLELRHILTGWGNDGMPEDLPATGAQESLAFALSVQSGETSIPTPDDVHCIYKRTTVVAAGVGTYLPLLRYENAYPPVYAFADPLLIPHPKIYSYIVSTNSSAAATCRFVLGFTYVALSGPQVMEALEVWRSVVA